jgi:hypothetical protein
MIVDGYAFYFLIALLFIIFATLHAKGYGILLSFLAVIISWFTSPLLVLLLCLLLVPSKKGSFWDE